MSSRHDEAAPPDRGTGRFAVPTRHYADCVSEDIKVAVIGAAGRMGSTVCRAIEAAPDMTLVGRFDVGDDLGDLPAFDAVDELRDAGIPGVLVCSSSDEGPEQLRRRADVVVDGPQGVVALLRTLLDPV